MSILPSVAGRRGHFVTESGYHTDVWLDLETLCRRPATIQPLARGVAAKLRPYTVDAVCGPLNEGAFIALLVAAELGCDFTYAERFADRGEDGRLFPIRYAVPRPLRPLLAGRRVAIVNDVVSAGSAVRGAFEDLRAHGAQVVAIGCLLVMGDAIDAFVREHSLAVETLERLPYHLWTPDTCPLCQGGEPLESVT
jgi:orotate phosphoribosyltransferase